MRAPTIGWFSVGFAPQTRIVAGAFDIVERVGGEAGAEHAASAPRRSARGRPARSSRRCWCQSPRARTSAPRSCLRWSPGRSRARRRYRARGARITARSRSATNARASSHEARRQPVAVPNHRFVTRSSAATKSKAYRPFTQRCPCSRARRAPGGSTRCAPLARADIQLAARRRSTGRWSGSTRRGSVVEQPGSRPRARRSGRYRRTRRSRRTSSRGASGRPARCVVSHASLPHVPDELPLQLRADAHAAVALDAPRHVDRDVRMRVVYEAPLEHRLRRSRGKAPNAHLPMELFLREAFDGPGWILAGQRLDDRPAGLFKLRSVRLDLHTVSERGRARRNQPGRPRELHQTRPAHACRRDPFVMAERRDVNVQSAERVEHGSAAPQLVSTMVDDDARHVRPGDSLEQRTCPTRRPLLDKPPRQAARLLLSSAANARWPCWSQTW